MQSENGRDNHINRHTRNYQHAHGRAPAGTRRHHSIHARTRARTHTHTHTHTHTKHTHTTHTHKQRDRMDGVGGGEGVTKETKLTSVLQQREEK